MSSMNASAAFDEGPKHLSNGSTGPPPLQPVTLNASAAGSESVADGGGGDSEKGKSFWALLVLAETHAVYPLLIAAGLLCNSLAIVTLRQRNLRTNLTYFRYAHSGFSALCEQLLSVLGK